MVCYKSAQNSHNGLNVLGTRRPGSSIIEGFQSVSKSGILKEAPLLK